MTFSCGYRIYYGWRGFDGDAAGPIEELSLNAAKNMGVTVLKIEQVRNGEDERGDFLDFTVTYSDRHIARAI